MKRIRVLLLLTTVLFAACAKDIKDTSAAMPDNAFLLSNDKIAVAIGQNGSLACLRNMITGHDYAADGLLWRMYYDSPAEKEIQVLGSDQTPDVSVDGDVITIKYRKLVSRGTELDMQVTLTVTLEEDKVRFGSALINNEPHTVIRELQYPLVHGAQLPKDHKLFTAEAGGQLFDNPAEVIGKISSSPYKKPEQFFRQKDVKYGAKVFMNCFGLFGENQGLYFGSHDQTFQDTWHGLRQVRCFGIRLLQVPPLFCRRNVGMQCQCHSSIFRNMACGITNLPPMGKHLVGPSQNPRLGLRH